MPKILLTGASGFIAAHILKLLLQRGDSVIVTVRSEEKAAKIKNALCAPQLEYRVVEDIAQPGAFDEAMKIEGLEVVIHTASPFQINVKDVKKDLLSPAINGTKGLLAAIKKNAPSVKKVVITSSFAAVSDVNKNDDDTSFTYSEKSWNTVTQEQALQNPFFGYRASKTFAERAAWEFVEKEKPNFTLTTVNPPWVFGPPIDNLMSLENLNTSNQRLRDLILGKYKNQSLDINLIYWVDVRDVAVAHIKAFEIEAASGKRLLVIAGQYFNKDTVEILRKNFPEFAAELPGSDIKHPERSLVKYDNSLSRKILGNTKYTLEQSVVDTVKGLKKLMA